MKRSSFLLLLLAIPAVSGSFSLFSDTLDLDVGTYRYIKFRITPDQMENAEITVDLPAEPLAGEIEFILISEMDYRRGWEGRGNIDTLAVVYAEGGRFAIRVPDFGDYVLIMSNRGNYNPVLAVADISVSFAGSGVAYDSLPFAMTLLMSLLAIGVVVAAVLITLKLLYSGRG